MKDRIYLVLIPEYPTAQIARFLQEEVNKRYGLYNILPTLHITLDSFYAKAAEENAKVVAALQEICLKLEPFPIIVDGFACFGPPYKSVQLHVVKTPPLKALYDEVHSKLQDLGFQVQEFPEGVQLHMTIASICFASREWSYAEYAQACQELQGISLESGFTLQRLELWYPELDPEKRLLASFELH